MGDTYSFNVMCALCSGIPMLYPSSDPDLDPEAHFHVMHGDPDDFNICDEEFSQPLRIDKSIKTNAHCDLAKWHQAWHYPKTPFNKEMVDLDLSLLDFLNGHEEPNSEEFTNSASNWVGNDALSNIPTGSE